MKKQTSDENIEKIKQEGELWKNKYLRALADYQNLEKRTISERSEKIKYAAVNFITKLLSAVDTLEVAEKSVNDKGLTIGMNQLRDIITSEGVKKIDVVGKKFDPFTMECTEIVESDQDEVVTEEVRAGYMMDDKLIRAARVKVAKKTIKDQQVN